MADQYGEFVGVDNLYYALVTADTLSAYTAGTPAVLAPVAEIAGSPTVNKKVTYYNNKPRNTHTTEAETEITVTVSNVPARLAATLLGKYYDSFSGRVLDTGETNPPDVALGFRYNMGTDGYRYYWYLKGTFLGGPEDAKSKETDVDVKTYQLTYTAITTEHEFTVNSESKSMKRVYADTADSAFVATSWFTQVQTPDTTSAPDALALSSIVPASGATGVSASANIVLTFNNKIASHSVVLVDDVTDAIVAAAYTWDATGKILTINPTNNMTATDKHAVAVFAVTDIYGQVLANSLSYFTVS
ncbi:MAG: major tail protein [Clostridiaceae bacterium]|nr:major tail protein [Clostridiaceae bacterium]